jgi:hypothetical protein
MSAEVREEVQLRALNAAVVSFYAHAHQRGSSTFTSPLLRTARLPDAAEMVLKVLNDPSATPRVAEAAERVRCFGLASLVTSALTPSQRMPQTDDTIRRLAGSDYPTVAQYIEQFTDANGDGVGDRAGPAQVPMTRARLIASLLVGSARSERPRVQGDVGRGVSFTNSVHPPAPGIAQRKQPKVQFDPVSMVTTVPAQGHYYGNLKEMARYLDPRSWATSSPEFWVTSRRVERVGDRFVPMPQDEPPLGESWSGLFEERVVLCFEGGILSGYTNHLNVRFESHINEADPTKSRVWVGFSLYQCESSVQLMRFAPSGMDVDEGYAYYWQDCESVVEPLGDVCGVDDMTVWADCVKRVRYTDMLTRRTDGQGSVGAGEMMNYLAPGGLGLWLDYVVAAGPHAGMTRAMAQGNNTTGGAKPTGAGAR